MLRDNGRDMTSTPAPVPNGQDTPATQKPTTAHARSPHWLTRKHAAISAVLGLIMLVLAVVAPLVSPEEQRGEVLIITVLFGLAGALMLFTAVDSSRQRVDAGQVFKAGKSLGRDPVVGKEAARALLMRQQEKGNRSRKLAGFVFGLFFGLAGMIAPFVLSEGSDNPDARFLMIVGFSPVAISGALMVMLFGRSLWTGVESRQPSTAKPQTASAIGRNETITSSMATVGIISGIVLSLCAVALPLISTGVMRNGIGVPAAVMGALGMSLSLIGGVVLRKEATALASHRLQGTNSTAPRVRRAPVARIPATALFRFIVPAVIVLLLVLIIAVILIVIAATISPIVQ